MEVTSHTEGEVVNAVPVIVIQAPAEIDQLVMYMNDQVYYPAKNGSIFSWDSLVMGEGSNFMEFYAPGYLQPVATRTINLTPPPAPVITITSHTEGEVVTALPIALRGTVQNPVGSLTINGMDVKLDGEDFIVPYWDLHEGNNTIEIVAKGPGTHGKETVHSFNLINQSNEAPRQITLSQGGKTYFRHEFTVPAEVRSGNSRVSVYMGDETPSGLEQFPWWGYESISGGRSVFTVEMALINNMSPGVYSFPISMLFKDENDKLKAFESVTVDLTVSDENIVELGTSIDGKELLSIDSTIMNSIDTFEFTPSSLPTGVGVNFTHRSLNSSDSTAEIYFDVYASPDAVPGSYSVPVTMKFLSADSSELYSVVRNIDINVVLPQAGPPTVVIGSHYNGEAVTTPQVTISGTVADFNATVLVNGQFATVEQTNGSEGTFSADITLEDGANQITVEATGEGGLKSRDEITINLSSQSSGGGLVIPAGDTAATSESFQFDPISFYEVRGYQVSVGGSNAAIAPNDFTVTPIQGELSWVVGFDVSVSPSTSPGDYELTVTHIFLDGNGQTILEESRVLKVEVTE
ncbi:hypothetical protein P3339_13825 [Microbulbifer sp. MLAF003]|uniref:hypothetical protein n=1 Tax=Microbulbifer sp. MLAF003 TaxID=3032582 RepID=UPI0024AC9394|nr:hypothetical protein [Microbulbifer sp. MLAF003]WHI49548.1 hypothetical protein P3339_13825 [Microbulbifer sp. MLAF003]